MTETVSDADVGVAVIGMGNMGTRHLATLKRLGVARTVAVSQQPDRVNHLRDTGVTVARDLREWSEWRPALGIVASNTGRHAADALKALGYGLDLLVEKPLAATAEEAAQIHAAATRAGRRVFVGCILRFSESLNAFRDRLSRIGRPHAVTIECRSYLPQWRPSRPYRGTYSVRADEGGVLRDVIHEIDYAGWLFGWPCAVQARVRNMGRLEIAADETADLNWETPAGCLVTISLDYLSRPARRRVAAFGEFGTLEWDGMSGEVTLALRDAPPEIVQSAQTRDELFAAQTRAFLDVVRGGPDPRLATSADGVRALAVCDAARRASVSKREEAVWYP